MIQIDSVVLDKDMFWSDEYKWSPVVGVADRLLDGSLARQVYPLVNGRPITLVGLEESGWQSRATVAALFALAAAPDVTRTLILYEQTFYVRFRYEEPPLEFEPISLFIPETGSTEYWYRGTIRLVTVG